MAPRRSARRRACISATRWWCGRARNCPARWMRLRGQRVRIDAEATPPGSPIGCARRAPNSGRRGPLPPAARLQESGGARRRARRASARRRGDGALPVLVRQRSAEGRADRDGVGRRSCWRFRRRGRAFPRGIPFPPSPAPANTAPIVHYRVTPKSPIAASAPDEVYLIDSGGQFLDGTTDITRTLWTGRGGAGGDQGSGDTRVMQGHIALATGALPGRRGGAASGCAARRRCGRPDSTTTMAPDTGSGLPVGRMRARSTFSRAAKVVPSRQG